MPDTSDDEVVKIQARERLRQTDLEVKGHLLPGHVKGRLTEDGMNALFDSLSVGGFKIARK